MEKDVALALRWRADGAVEVGKVEPGASADGRCRCGRTARHAALVPSTAAPRKRGRDPGRKRRLRGERGRDCGQKRRAEPLAAAGWRRWLPSPGGAWWLRLLRPPLRAEHPVGREPDLGTDAVAVARAPDSNCARIDWAARSKAHQGRPQAPEEPSGCVARPDVVAQALPFLNGSNHCNPPD